MVDIRRVAAEWVITNGVLPGFKERVDSTLGSWDTVPEGGMTVYRAHGHNKVGIVKLMDDPSKLTSGLRPVLATSQDLNAIVEFAGDDCCIFVITLQPGTRYLDIERVTAEFFDKDVRDTLNPILDDIKRESVAAGLPWPTSRVATNSMRFIMRGRVLGIPGKKLPEKELLVYDEGELGERRELGEKIAGKTAYQVIYGPKKGRGRTFRRKAKRSNKNGHRSTRKSQRRVQRNRHA